MPRKPKSNKAAASEPQHVRAVRSLAEIREESRRLIDAAEGTLRRLRELQSDVVDQVAKLQDDRAKSQTIRRQRPKP